MKNKLKNKFLFINASDANRIVSNANEYDADTEDANITFDKYNIPVPYRKLVISLNKIHDYCMGEEIVSNTSFDIYGLDNNNEKFITFQTASYSNNGFIEFTSLHDIKNRSEIIKFLKSLKESNLYDSYINAVLDFLRSKNNIKDNSVMLSLVK